MFLYIEEYNESEYRMKNNNLLYKTNKNAKMHLTFSIFWNLKNQYFQKNWVQDDQRFMPNFMALFIFCIFSFILYTSAT